MVQYSMVLSIHMASFICHHTVAQTFSCGEASSL